MIPFIGNIRNRQNPWRQKVAERSPEAGKGRVTPNTHGAPFCDVDDVLKLAAKVAQLCKPTKNHRNEYSMIRIVFYVNFISK